MAKYKYKKLHKKLQSPIFGVLINIDKTIFNMEENFIEGLKAAYKEFKTHYGPRIRFKEFKNIYLISKSIVERSQSENNVYSSQLLYFKTMFNILSIKYDIDVLKRLDDAYWSAILKYSKSNSGLIEFLKLCKDNFIKIGVITGLDIETQVKKLEYVLGEDWSNYIDVVVTAKEIGVNKNNPAVYLYAINLLGIHNPLNILVIDRDIENLKIASLLGMQTIKYGEEFESFHEIIEYLSLEKRQANKEVKVIYFDLFGVIIKEAHFSKILKEVMRKETKKFNRHKYLLWSMGIIDHREMGLDEIDIKNIINRIKFNESALDVIENLKEKNVKIGVISNIPKEVYENLDVNGLFDDELTIISGDFKRRKPDSILTYIAIKKAKTYPRNIYFIDDRPKNLKPAKLHGANTILINSIRYKDKAYPWVDYKIKNIRELLNLQNLIN